MLIAGMLNIFFALALNYTNYRWKLHGLVAHDKSRQAEKEDCMWERERERTLLSHGVSRFLMARKLRCQLQLQLDWNWSRNKVWDWNSKRLLVEYVSRLPAC